MIRVLCIHGSQQTKEIFRARLGKLPKKAKEFVNFEFVDGPHELALREGDSVPTRTWWIYTEGNETREKTMAESLEMLKKHWAENGPFDGVLGFSMGGTMACAMAAINMRENCFPGLRFVLVGGSPGCVDEKLLWGSDATSQIPIPSLHVMGTGDKVVACDQSRALAGRFKDPEIFVHDQGHCFPTKADAFKIYLDFLKQQVPTMEQNCGQTDHLATEESVQEQMDELDALESIYPDTIKVLTPAPRQAGDPCAKVEFQLQVPESPKFDKKIRLVIQFSSDYPASLPSIHLEHEFNMLDFPSELESNLLNHVKSEIEPQIGMPMAYSCVNTAEEWLQVPDHLIVKPTTATSPDQVKVQMNGQSNKDLADDEEDEVDDHNNRAKIWESDEMDEEKENEMVHQASVEACQYVANMKRDKKQKHPQASSGVGRGVTKFIIGLVGKPSVGKSSLFNCITRLQTEAKVAAHPFTTIEPNFGTGWWASNDLHDMTKEHGARHGRDAKSRRLLPLMIKDVAGLIPGAYKGHGKGNKFLNDLVDCHVLVHVVDASGSSDRNGVEVAENDGSASNPEQDIKWVREEIHRWVFGNVAAKWRSVVRNAKKNDRAAEERLLELFSGYRGATKNAVHEAARRAGLDVTMPQKWTHLDLHRLVAHFISVRFNMVLALNKCDKLVEKKNLEKLEEAKKIALQQGYLAAPCSAVVESFLLRLAKQNMIKYELGGSTFEKTIEEAESNLKTENEMHMKSNLAKEYLSTFGTTGVLDLISSSIYQLDPILVYPVSDLRQGTPLLTGENRHSKTLLASYHTLKFLDCLQALPGSTIDDIFTTLKRGTIIEEYKLDGDFIRAEVTSMRRNAPMKQCGKDFVLTHETSVLKILCNKKVVWQQKVVNTAEKSK